MVLAVGRASLRIILILSLVGFATAVSLHQVAFRALEATSEGWLLRTVAGTQASVTPDRATVWAGDSPNIWGLQITPECSAALLVAGFAIIAAVVIAVRRRRLELVLLGALLAMAVVVIANFVRISVVVASTLLWGQAGFHWSHTYLGTAITVAGLLVATVAFLACLGRGGSVKTWRMTHRGARSWRRF